MLNKSDQCLFNRKRELDKTYITEGSTHDNGVVVVLLVVVEDLLHGLNTRVLITLVVLASVLLVPIKNLKQLIRNYSS
jgi:hypothetical protein